MFEVTTKSGAKYHLDTENNFWKKFSREGMDYGWERTWRLMHGFLSDVTGGPWEKDTGWIDGLPVVGSHLYVSSKDVWWISTEVVSIEEVEGGIR